MACHLRGDSTSADGIGNRGGAGKIRHIHTPTLWLQGHIAEKRILQNRVVTADNPADFGTKHLSAAEIRHHMKTLGFEFRDGTSTLALSVS